MLKKYMAGLKTMPKMFLRMFFYNYIFFLSLLFVLCAGVWGFSFHQSRQVLEERAVSHCQSLSDCFNGLFAAFNRLSVTVGHNQLLQELSSDPVTELDFSLLDSTMLFSVQQEMVTFLATDSSISNLAIYLYGKEYVISTYGTSTLDSFYQSLFLMEPNPASEYLRPLYAGSFLFLPRTKDSRSVLSQNSVYVISLVDTNGTRYGNLFLFLDDREIRQKLEKMMDSGESYYVYTAQDETVMKNGDAPSKDELLSSGRNGSGTVYSLEDKNGWSFHVETSHSVLRKQMLFTTLIIIAVWLLGAIISLPVTYTLCRKNYRPIDELADMISRHAAGTDPASDGAKKRMEYETLKLAISSIFTDKRLMDEQISIYRPVLINSLLLQLLEGGSPVDSILKGLAALGAVLPYGKFRCLSLQSVSMHQEFFIDKTYAVKKKGQCSCLFVSIDRHTGYYIVNAPSEELCTRAVLALAAFLNQASDIISVGAGNCLDGFTGLSQSYRQAKEARHYLCLKNQGKFVPWDKLENTVIRLTPPPALNSFFSLLSCGQFSEADRELEKYWERAVSFGYIRKADLIHFQQSLLTALQQLKKEQDFSCSDTDFSALLSWSVNLPDSVADLRKIWADIRNSLSQNYSLRKEKKDMEDVRIFLDYLQEHIYEEDLSLSRLADTFRVSESTISRRIRSFTGYNFLDYVTGRRIAHACTLLTETDMPIQDIAAATGYLNDVTFRRLFKKQMGLTPSEYRQEKGRHIPE